jgi:hypothetical protein
MRDISAAINEDGELADSSSEQVTGIGSVSNVVFCDELL